MSKQSCLLVIQLVQYRGLLLDPEDYEKYKLYKAQIVEPGYAIVYTGKPVKRQYLHKLILPDVEMVDHKNQNKLDNRRDNLRSSNHSKNAANIALPASNTSGYRGVHFCNTEKKFVATCANRRIGYFPTAWLAALAYNTRAVQVFKEAAQLNKL